MGNMSGIVKQLKKERDRRKQATQTAQVVSKSKSPDRGRTEEAMGSVEGKE
jgi:hypothetical protein